MLDRTELELKANAIFEQSTLEDSKLMNRREFLIVSAGLTGIAAVVEFLGGCALGPKVIYPKGAPYIAFDWEIKLCGKQGILELILKAKLAHQF